MAPEDSQNASRRTSAAADLNNSGLALYSHSLHSEALEKFQAALVLEPSSPVILNNRGACYFSLDLFQEAINSYNKAIALKPRYVEAHNNLGNALVKLFQHEEALQCYDQALALDPGYVEAYWNKALGLLQLGRFTEGWFLHESRWAKPSFQPIVRHFSQPIWDGSFPIAGKTLLLHAEQGLGDTLQFVRYVELVKALGARIVLEVQAPLVPLFDGLLGVEALVKQGDPFLRLIATAL
jgi:tetratricopeptide (TPR) repeat protein